MLSLQEVSMLDLNGNTSRDNLILMAMLVMHWMLIYMADCLLKLA